MNVAEKFIQKQIKEIEIDGTVFRYRKINPEDTYLMNRNLSRFRTKAKKRIEEEGKDCDDCPKTIKFTIEELQEIADNDRRIVLPRTVISPKITLNAYGQQEKDEVPFDLLDNRTSIELFDAIQKSTLEVFEGVSLDSFPDERQWDELDESKSSRKHSSEPDSGELSSEDKSAVEDEIGRILGEDEGSSTKERDRTSKRASRKNETKKKKTISPERKVPRKVPQKNND